MLPRAGLTVGTFFEKYIHRCIPSKLVSDVNLQREDSMVHPCLAAKSWTHCNIMRVMRMMMMTSSHFYILRFYLPPVLATPAGKADRRTIIIIYPEEGGGNIFPTCPT